MPIIHPGFLYEVGKMSADILQLIQPEIICDVS